MAFHSMKRKMTNRPHQALRSRASLRARKRRGGSLRNTPTILILQELRKFFNWKLCRALTILREEELLRFIGTTQRQLVLTNRIGLGAA